MLKLIFLALFSFSAFANSDLPEPITKLLTAFKKSPHLRKLETLDGAVAITYKNQTVYQYSFGYRKNRTGKITSETLFPLASASKPISAAMISYLVKQKKLSFEDKAQSVIPTLDPRIQLKHLLSHSAGYDDLIGNKAIESGKPHEDLARLFTGPTLYPPGSHYSYSNVLFSLIEDMIFQKTQSTYLSSMEKFLRDAGIDTPQICHVTRPDQVAFPHRLGKKHLISMKLPKNYPESTCSAGGLFLSVDQMSRFVNLMLGHLPQVLDQKDLEPLFQPQVEVTDIFKKWQIKWPFPLTRLKSYYGLGWRLMKKEGEKNPFIFHSGHLNGVTTFVGFLPEKDLGVIILSNQDAVFSENLGLDFWQHALQ